MVDMTLWENYRNVCFIAPSLRPPGLPAHAIVTAWNPASQWVGIAITYGGNQRAWMRPPSASRASWGRYGGDADERWQEDSCCCRSLQEEAIRLAARFGQNALYWVAEGELWLVPVPAGWRALPSGESGFPLAAQVACLRADIAPPRHPGWVLPGDCQHPDMMKE